MKYMGSKARIAKYIVPIIQKYIDDYNAESYYEPFVGGANVIDKIKAQYKYGSDIQEYLIELYKNIDKLKELPVVITKEEYSKVRDCYNNKTTEFSKWYIGAIGFLASYNGRFYDGGYAGIVTTKNGTVRNYYAEAKRNLESQTHNLKDTTFSVGDYSTVTCSNSVIYCDPPYKDTKHYGTNKTFDYDKFWQWVKDMSKENIVLVSECQAPEGFECIWQQEIIRTIDNTKRVSSVEKLFKLTEQN